MGCAASTDDNGKEIQCRTDRPLQAAPGQRIDSHQRVRTDRVDAYGTLTLRINGKLHHISIGRAYARTRFLMLIHNHDVRIIDASTGELSRHLTIDPPGLPNPRSPLRTPTKKALNPQRGFRAIRMSYNITWRWRRDLNPRRDARRNVECALTSKFT